MTDGTEMGRDGWFTRRDGNLSWDLFGDPTAIFGN